MDQIFILALKLEAIIGIHPEERLIPQSIVLDIALTTDTQKAATSDNITDAVDYSELVKKLQEWVMEKQFQLIETLANDLAQKILQTFLKVQSVQLKLHKFPADLPIGSAGIVVVRGRDVYHLKP